MCTAARWTGAAADAFIQHWSQAAVGATGVGALYDAAGQIVYELAGQLYETDVTLRSWATQMAAEGAVINPDGSPGTVPIGPSAGPSNAAEATAEYAALRQEYLLLADGFRLEALRAIGDLLDATHGMLTGSDVQPSVTKADLVTYGGLLRSFAAVPVGAVAFLAQKAAEARETYESMSERWRAMGGGRGGVPAEVKTSRTSALRELTRLREKLAAGAAILVSSLGGAPVVAVGLGVLAGGVVAVGVGEFVYQAMDQDWGGLIEEHGVLGGIGEGLQNTAAETGEALGDMFEGMWNWAFG